MFVKFANFPIFMLLPFSFAKRAHRHGAAKCSTICAGGVKSIIWIQYTIGDLVGVLGPSNLNSKAPHLLVVPDVAVSRRLKIGSG